jgi:hypothetical protein
VFNTEGEMVAWCTKPGKGTRLIPNGAITGLQFMKTSDYIQVVGFVNQGMINLIDGNPGGEMDPHGADLVSPVIVFRPSPSPGVLAFFLVLAPLGLALGESCTDIPPPAW